MHRPACRPRRGRRTASLVAAVMIVAAAAACGDDTPKSDTPELAVSDPEGDELYLAIEDVAIFPGFDGAEIKDTSDVPLFENPDPRGPCGEPVTAPSLDGAGARSIAGATIGLVQLIVPTGEDEQRYLEAMRADLRPDCRSYESVTNTGEVQRVSEITAFELSGEGVDGLGWTSLLEIGTQGVFTGALVIDTEGYTTYVQIRSQTAIPTDGMHVLADRAVRRLRSEG